MSDAAIGTGADLAGLVVSRLCHDLVSPLGAIGNGLELLDMSSAFPGLARAPEMELINDSIGSARARIRMCRVAFGTAEPKQRIAASELAGLLSDMAGASRLRPRLEAEGDLPRTDARLVLLALMCLESALPWGGEVLVVRTAEGWRLVASTDRIKIDKVFWSMLEGGPIVGDVSAAQVHFALLRAYTDQEKRTLSVDYDDQGAEIAF